MQYAAANHQHRPNAGLGKSNGATGQTEVEVIRRVGRAVAYHARLLTTSDDLILILAGKGHNGDDARGARTFLLDRRTDLLDVKDPAADLPHLESLLSLRPALVIDGLFGIGINRPLDGAWIRFIERLNAAAIPTLAVDVPSGLNGDTGEPQGAAVNATVTLTVGAPKIGFLRNVAWPHVGRLEVTADVGLIPARSRANCNGRSPRILPDIRLPAPWPAIRAPLVISRSSPAARDFMERPVLASRGAQRARPGLITVFPHESAYAPVAAQLQAVMAQPWTDAGQFGDKFDAILAGPGLASPEVPEAMKACIRNLWRDFPGPMVVDASALAWLEPGAEKINAVRLITPHPGEAARMLSIPTAEVQANRAESLRQLSRRYGGCSVVLKGHQTLVGGAEGELFVNPSGSPDLAQGGSGDLLGGYLGGLLAHAALQSDAARTIRYGVWRHGLAADWLSRARPNWVVEDLAERIGL